MFKDSFRIERIYFEKLKTMIPVLKDLISAGDTKEAKALLENAVDANGAILLLYRNLGEAWAELADLIEKLRKELDKQNETIQEYHDELNAKIDDVNNYIMQLIREINARLDSIEADLASMNRVKFLDLIATESQEKQGRKTVRSVSYSLQLDGVTVDFAAVTRLVDFPHLVIVREETSGGVNYYYTKKADTTAETGSVSWHSVEITSGTTVTEKNVAIAADDTVTVATVEREIIHYTAGTNITIDADNVISAAGGGGGGLFIIKAPQETVNYTYVPDKTYAEVSAAIANGDFPVLILSDSYGEYLNFYDYSDGTYHYFVSAALSRTYNERTRELVAYTMVMDQNNTLSYGSNKEVYEAKTTKITFDGTFDGTTYEINAAASDIYSAIGSGGDSVNNIIEFKIGYKTGNYTRKFEYQTVIECINDFNQQPSTYTFKTIDRVYTATGSNHPTYTPAP